MTRTTQTPLLLAAAALGVAVLSSPSDARAQAADLNPVAPNVMLAVDSSGSMEYTATPASDCTTPPCEPKCYPDETTAADHEKSRWIDLVEVLTGSIRDYTCWAQDRSTTDFADEYRLGTVEAVDSGGAYSLPYHRPQSNLCTPGPGTLPATSAPHEFPANYRADHEYSIAGNAVTTSSTCSTWAQLNDGLLDTLNQQIRFGLMTFDTHPDEGTGYSAGIADYSTGTDGTWSYFLDSQSCAVVGAPDPLTPYCQGNPLGCTTGPFPMEVGARNQYAPPAEGRMVAFGPSDASGTELAQRNSWIQDVLLMTRPYGATPIAGLMADAREFFWNDQTTDPITGKDFGPYGDEQVADGCRRNFLVVLSDGEPNLDMRDECVGSICPYQEPGEIADDLVTGGGGANPVVRTYSIGFAVSEVDIAGTLTACEDLLGHLDDPCNDSAYDGYRELQACCTLNEIAYYGTPDSERATTGVINHALFADNPAELRAALARVFNEALSAVTARTQPVFSSASGSSAGARAFEFKAAVDVRSADLWRGKLERTRFVCDALTGLPEEQAVDEAEGDDFVANVNSAPSSRSFYTFVPDDETHSELSQRPYLASGVTDGVGTEGTGTESKGNDQSTFAAVLNEELMGVSDSLCDSASEDLTAAECAERIAEWLVGLDNGTGYHRCETPGSADCNVVADILHATPLIRGVPNEFLRDQSYAQFAGSLAQRDTVLYTSSNDGFFHAFLVAPGDPSATGVTTKSNNELWAFVPPAVMEGMPSQYPGTHQLLLDGKPVIKDVVASGAAFPYKLERTRTEAIAQSTGKWRTILVQSFGAQRGGYYALDITKPTADVSDAESGPRFLWQLTTDEAGKEIFGTNGTPLITTVFMEVGGSADPIREVAVAVLPGGNGGSPDGLTNCASESAVAQLDSNFTPAPLVDCYDKAEARSLTIVRLDSGEILKTFRATGVTEPVTFDASVLTNIDIPAPLVGEPAAFPAQTGSTADRIFIGDREGRLWRIDVTNTDPSEWNMQLFFDAYAHPVATTPRQPILTPPVMSVDDQGQITINFSTGDQDTLTFTDPLENYVYSLTEVIDPTTGEIQAQLNWRYVLDDGAVATGPLTLFDRRLFYSVFYPDQTGDVCAVPTSDVFGMNYIVPKLDGSGNPAESSPYTLGGKAEYPKKGFPGEFVQAYSESEGSRVDGVVFGVGLRQTPSCSIDATSPNTDDFLGYGTTTSTTSSNPGSFQLVFQKGGGSQGSDDIQSEVVDLAPPRTPVSIDTWAPILE